MDSAQDAAASNTVAWEPQLGPQVEAMVATWCPELLYGGAMGGGKTAYLLGDYAQDINRYGKAWHGIIFRRTYRELDDIMRKSQDLYPKLGGAWRATDKEWHFPNGAVLKMRYLERTEDWTHYQGPEYSWIGWDELTQWPDSRAYLNMSTRLRSSSHVPTKRIRATTNPGGRGHNWVKQRFVDPNPVGYMPILDPNSQSYRMFVPAKVTDNKILLHNDPGYINRLKGLDDPLLIKAWLDGDWTLPVGAMFPQFQLARHVVPDFVVPAHWFKWRGFDWGGSSPFSVHWYTCADGEPVRLVNGTMRRFPAGAIIAYREWYGCSATDPTKGCEMRNEDIAFGICQRTSEKQAWLTVTDSLPFQNRGGKGIDETFLNCGVPLTRGDTGRVNGWSQVRSRLIGGDSGPLLYMTESCPHLIRTLPALQRSPINPEDAEDGDDHAPDECRLACMCRPIVINAVKPGAEIVTQSWTFNDAFKKHLRNARSD